jgi:hypothetical protein
MECTMKKRADLIFLVGSQLGDTRYVWAFCGSGDEEYRALPPFMRERVTHGAYMRVQAELMPRGAEVEWIERHSAAYRAWVESFARVSDDGPPTMTEAALRTLARERFLAAPKQPVRARRAPAATDSSPRVGLDQSFVDAARALDLDDVRGALSLGADPGATGPGGDTALHYLASGQSMVAASVFEEVAEAGGDVHRRNDGGVRPADVVRGTGTAAMRAALARAEQRARSLPGLA